MNRTLACLALTLLLLLILLGLTLGVSGQSLPGNRSPVQATPVWLGNPVAGEAYSARHIWDLQVWRGRIYLGYGDWDANLGPVDIWHYSSTAGIFFSETVYVSPTRPAAPVDEDAIDRYVVIDDSLYIPGTDPRDPWDLGNFYRNDGSGWVKYRTIPDGIHAFDLAGHEGDLFAAIGPNNNAALVRSEDGGLSWTAAITEVGYTRFYELYTLAGTLFAIQAPTSVYSAPVLYRYQAPWFETTAIELIPDRPDDRVLVYDGVHRLGDTVLYIPWFGDEALSCVRPLPALYQARPEQDGWPVPFFEGKDPRDLVVYGGAVFVLDAGAARCVWDVGPPDPAGYTATVYASTDLVTWVPAATAHLTDTPNALEVLGGHAYVGTYNGDIYALDMAFVWRLYLPLFLRYTAPEVEP